MPPSPGGIFIFQNLLIVKDMTGLRSLKAEIVLFDLKY
jgi:hypothetical protein